MTKTKNVPGPRKNAPVGKSVNANNKKVNNNKSQNKQNKNNKQIVVIQKEVPKSYSNKVQVKKPRVGKNGSIAVSHAEFLTDLNLPANENFGLTFFNVYKIRINPGLPKVFPWCSSLARNFEEYKVSNLKIHFVSDCSTSTFGTIMMTASYDPSLPSPSSLKDFSNLEGCVSDNVYKSLTFTVNKKGMNSQEHYYVRSTKANTNIKNEDIKLLDCCVVYVGLSNVAGTDTGLLSIGQIWLEYDLVLLRPHSDISLQQVVNSSSFTIFGPGTVSTVPFSTYLSNGIGSGGPGIGVNGKFTSGDWVSYQNTNAWIAHSGVGTKLISTVINGTGITSGLVISLYQYTPLLNDDGNEGFKEVVTDAYTLCTIADVSLTSFTALTTASNIIVGLPMINLVSSATQGRINYIVNLPNDCIIKIDATASCTTITSCGMTVTDFDFRVPQLATFASSGYL